MTPLALSRPPHDDQINPHEEDDFIVRCRRMSNGHLSFYLKLSAVLLASRLLVFYPLCHDFSASLIPDQLIGCRPNLKGLNVTDPRSVSRVNFILLTGVTRTVLHLDPLIG